MQHHSIKIKNSNLHVVAHGQGPALLFIHGWPEFWLTWQPVMERLSDRFMVIAPDLRGFGHSDKPDGEFGPSDHALDMIALMDALNIPKFGVIGHDVGGAVIQPLARLVEDRIFGLFLFNFVYPGIGERMGTPDRLKEIWYQSFNQMDIAPKIIGTNRESCKAYIGHFLRHWSYQKHAFDDVLEIFIDNFMQPGNLEGGFAHYKASHAGRIAMMTGQAPHLPPINVKTCVRWSCHDPLFPYEWTDQLHKTFTHLDLAPFEDVGHFPHRENPERAANEIAAFFSSQS
jgi:pimeloyl-ACP methyl ester carboxylesterase